VNGVTKNSTYWGRGCGVEVKRAARANIQIDGTIENGDQKSRKAFGGGEVRTRQRSLYGRHFDGAAGGSEDNIGT